MLCYKFQAVRDVGPEDIKETTSVKTKYNRASTQATNRKWSEMNPAKSGFRALKSPKIPVLKMAEPLGWIP